jgi:hypothetical protein
MAASLIAATGCMRAPGVNSEASPTPLPTPPNTLAAICNSTGDSLAGPERRLAVPITDDNLVDQGTAAAIVTGILATDVDRMRALEVTSGSPAAMRWFEEIDAAVSAGVRAVRASAASDVTSFKAALMEYKAQRARAAMAAEELGQDECLY